MITKEEVQKRVAVGAAFMDEKEPGWAEKIEPTRLTMIEPCHCILGQLHGNYYRAFDEVVNEGHDALGLRAVELGFIPFTPEDGVDDQDWMILEDAWLEEIAKRTHEKTTTHR